LVYLVQLALERIVNIAAILRASLAPTPFSCNPKLKFVQLGGYPCPSVDELSLGGLIKGHRQPA
jgi:hypothetical protein